MQRGKKNWVVACNLCFFFVFFLKRTVEGQHLLFPAFRVISFLIKHDHYGPDVVVKGCRTKEMIGLLYKVDKNRVFLGVVGDVGVVGVVGIRGVVCMYLSW